MREDDDEAALPPLPARQVVALATWQGALVLLYSDGSAAICSEILRLGGKWVVAPEPLEGLDG